MKSSKQRYGWMPDTPDSRDMAYVVAGHAAQALPTSIDLRPQCPPVYDQGQLGSCTANAIAAAIAFEQRKLKAPLLFTPSRLFIYFNERAQQGTVDVDSGAPLREGIKAVNRVGVCPEDEHKNAGNWPYDPALFAHRPPESCYTIAHHVRTLRYSRLLHQANDLKGCLAEGYPFVFGITVYKSFEGPGVKKTGIVLLPAKGEKEVGGHAVMAVGYDDARQAFIVRNSWGAAWGDRGYFYLPYDYVLAKGLARDFWTIRLVSDTLEAEQPATMKTQAAKRVTPEPKKRKRASPSNNQ